MLYSNNFNEDVDNYDDLELNDEGMISFSELFSKELQDEYGDDFEEDYFMIKHLSSDTNYVYRVNNPESLETIFDTLNSSVIIHDQDIEEYIDILLENCFFPCDIYISIDEEVVEVGEYY